MTLDLLKNALKRYGWTVEDINGYQWAMTLETPDGIKRYYTLTLDDPQEMYEALPDGNRDDKVWHDTKYIFYNFAWNSTHNKVKEFEHYMDIVMGVE